MSAAAGRLFDPAPPASDSGSAVLGRAFWMRRCGGSPSVIGRGTTVNGKPRDVIGVAAGDFGGTGLFSTDLWVPIDQAPSAGSPLWQRDAGWALARGRVKRGVSIAQAVGQVNAIGQQLLRDYPRAHDGRTFRAAAAALIPGDLSVPVAGALLLVFGFVSLVLGVACTNLAGVLLARGHQRRREIAVRLALGVGRGRLIRQLLTETMLLFALGGAAGASAHVLTSWIAWYLPALPVPVDVSLSLDGRVIAFTTGLSLIAAIACGLIPAFQASNPHVIGVLKHDDAVSASATASGETRLSWRRSHSPLF